MNNLLIMAQAETAAGMSGLQYLFGAVYCLVCLGMIGAILMKTPKNDGLGGMMGGGGGQGMGGMMSMGQAIWSINGTSMTGDGHAGMLPLFTLAQGKTHLITMRNSTAWWHPMHLHGFSFRVLTRNGAEVPHRQWADTVLMAPEDTVEVAFVADNPGDWMLHCHVTDHQVTGLMTVLRVGGAT